MGIIQYLSEPILFILLCISLIFSLTFHEYAHGIEPQGQADQPVQNQQWELDQRDGEASDRQDYRRHNRLKNDQYHECGEVNIPGTWHDAPYGKYQGVRDLDDRLRERAVEIGSDPLQDEPKQEG